ncbi:hypothetical protein [Pantoea sp. At-9b]|uniref:hypothetical protein n=1 Tax=Pantoea sp. (strain At-9b) TaxID=592316 RepID=UPI0001B3E1F7|nr:hypothetical protein [Pantoea sp. At-9b]ADU71517.1 hypothetical protein Pat9b_5360 [Pantoea sp. At-9b]
MNNAKSNRELVKVGHEFAKSLSVETLVSDINQTFRDLSTRLDVANTRANVMAGEVLRLNALIPGVIKALQSAGDHDSLIADLNEAMITPTSDQWIKELHAQAVGQTRQYVQHLADHKRAGVSDCLNLISQLEMDLLRDKQANIGSAA